MNWTATGAIALALAVILGAFGAWTQGPAGCLFNGHLRTSVFYQFIHAMGLLVVSILPGSALFRRQPARGCAPCCWPEWPSSPEVFTFSPTGIRMLGAVTPLGGLSFIAAWVLLAIAVLQRARPE